MSAQRVPPPTSAALALTARRDVDESVVLVDDQDRAIGTAGKLEVHRTGTLHRAFSILLFDGGERLLLQRRAASKYHFGECWSNTCCGHPRPGEPIALAAARRLGEEFGIQASLTASARLIYRAEDPGSGLIEHEYLHIFHGIHTGAPCPDPTEVGAWRWMPMPAIRRAIARRPACFTPWFRLLIQRHPVAS